MRIALGCDHAAKEMKDLISAHLQKRGYDVEEFSHDEGENLDYPVYAERAAEAVKNGICALGILICGTGAGMCIAANKVNGIRAVSCSDAYTAKLSKEHNNANVLCFGSRVIGSEMAVMIVDIWLDAEFDAGGRHERRVEMFEQIEQRQRKH